MSAQDDDTKALLFCHPEKGYLVSATLSPTSITDSYAIIKEMRKRGGVRDFVLLVRGVISARAGLEVYRRLTRATDAFLDVTLTYEGHVLFPNKLEDSYKLDGFVQVDLDEKRGEWDKHPDHSPL